jgi:hypothetical protein
MARTSRGEGERIGKVRAVGDIVPAVGRAAFHRFGFVESSIVSRWAEIVGPTYARHSAPEALSFPRGRKSGGMLRVVVTSAFAPTMSHAAPQIVERVNRFFGYAAVERLSLRHGDVPQRHTQPGLDPAAEAPVGPEVSDTLRTIADDGLRASLEALARQLATTRGRPRFD